MSKDPKFKEKVDYQNAIIEEMQKKLGEENAALVSEEILALEGTISEATEIHDETIDKNAELVDKNAKLVEVNGRLFVKNRDKVLGTDENVGNQQQQPNLQKFDGDAAKEYARLVSGNI